MFFLQEVGLARDIVPLASADGVDVGSDVEPLLEQAPVFVVAGFVAWVGDGVAEVGNGFALPRMDDVFGMDAEG